MIINYIAPSSQTTVPTHAIPWKQRETHFGWLIRQDIESIEANQVSLEKWQQAQPIHLPRVACQEVIKYKTAIQQAATLVKQIGAGLDADTLFACPPYTASLSKTFEQLAASENLDDAQEISKIDFDRVDNGQILAEDLWLKIAWLSLQEGDESMRFRFSYGIEGYEDVAANAQAQQYAAELCEALFPESCLISQHSELKKILAQLQIESPAFVERIIYFNAEGGGAWFHQDVERGHEGVVYAQLSGQTLWLSLSKKQLLDEILRFPHLNSALKKHSRSALSTQLDERGDDIEALLNQTPEFSAQLVKHGHGYWLNAGDMLLLPQFDDNHCAWHAVYCLEGITGEGLSFALRKGKHSARL